MGQPSSDLRHPDLGFDYRKLVNISFSFQFQFSALLPEDGSSRQGQLIPPQGGFYLGQPL